MAVVDRWHKARPGEDEPTCREHDKVPSASHGQGDRWQVRWRDENGKQRAKLFKNKGKADVFDAKQRSDVHHGTSVDITGAKIRVSDYFAKWEASQIWRDSSRSRAKGMFNRHIKPVIGDMAMGAVRATHIRAVLKRASETLTESSLARLRTDLAMMFKAAVADRIIGVSPVETVKVAAPSREVGFIPTVDHCHAVAANLPKRYAAAAYVAAACGLRLGEILGLEVESINFLRREVTVTQQLVCPDKGGFCLGPTKTKTSVRTVELPEIVGNALAEHIQTFPPVAVEIEDRTDSRNPVTRKAKLLFTTPGGKPVHRRAWWDGWKVARDAAELPEGTGMHSFRHLYASSLIHAGASVKQVQMALGHARPSITLDVYTHLWPDTEGRTRKLIDGAFGAAPASKIQTAVQS